MEEGARGTALEVMAGLQENELKKWPWRKESERLALEKRV